VIAPKSSYLLLSQELSMGDHPPSLLGHVSSEVFVSQEAALQAYARTQSHSLLRNDFTVSICAGVIAPISRHKGSSS
jgi:hypothetical protein